MTEPRDAAAAPVFMRLVHADEREDGFVPVKPARISGTGSPRGRASSPHYSSPLPGKGEPAGGPEAPHSPGGAPEPNIQVLQNLLRSEAATCASSAATASPQNLGPNFSLWPPALLDQALRLGLLEPRATPTATPTATPRLTLPQGGPAPSGPWEPHQDPVVLALARRLGTMGEEAGNCSCHGPSPRRGPAAPPEPPEGPPHARGPPLEARLNRSLDRISGGALTPKARATSGSRCPSPGGAPGPEKLSSCRSRGKSRTGSLKLRLSKLFRTRSPGAGPGLSDKRPSLSSSTSSGGSLLDVWGSGSRTQDQGPSRLQLLRPLSAFSPVTPAFTGETVSLVDMDFSRRNALHPPTPPPPRRSFSLLDDFAGLPPQSFLGGAGGVSLQWLPGGSLVPSAGDALQFSDAFLRGLPRPIPLRPAPLPRPVPRSPLSQSDASSFATSLKELEKCGWYWGPMKWEEAEVKLREKPDGSFLVRDSSDPRFILSLSFRSQSLTHHTRMEHYRGTFSLWCQPKLEDRCPSVVEFMDRAIAHSRSGKSLYFLRSRVPGSPPTPVQLLYPVSRFTSVKSLQHLCRFCIRQTVRIDHIQDLPLPTPLILYLKKFYYYESEEEVQLKQT